MTAETKQKRKKIIDNPRSGISTVLTGGAIKSGALFVPLREAAICFNYHKRQTIRGLDIALLLTVLRLLSLYRVEPGQSCSIHFVATHNFSGHDATRPSCPA
ncbi:hypothetical protein ElyMa_001097500 [Elysia marginata]|uniref:Uncharacterized protein n=1 Tax=Elysia marginata TaxID=1093978 RepID=A0AAV4HY86_9GAST|nr:hypothetical protein ElyMa_001097500 [Elysia marginata]